MKNRMARRAEKLFCEWQQVRRPRDGRDHDGITAESLSIFQHNSTDAMIVFIERGELRLFAQFNPNRFRVFDECRNHATAFDITRVRIKEAVLKSIWSKRWKTLME